MVDYVQETVELYKKVAQVEKIKDASTPFCPDGSLPFADEDETGQLAGEACQILMKEL